MNRRIAQIALVVSDHHRSCDFYCRVFGLDHIFGTSSFRGEGPEKIQGLKNAAATTHWLVDDRERFQLEIFQYESPVSRPLVAQQSISDVGYNRLIVAVQSLEQTSERAEAAGATVTLMSSTDRTFPIPHALVRDPDGIPIEIVEAPEFAPGARGARIVGLGMTTPDMATTVEDMCEGFGFVPSEDIFNHDLFWQEGGRLQQSRTLRFGDMYLVVSQYRDSQPRPADYRLSDLGVMNFAIFYRDPQDLLSCYRSTVKMGMRANSEPIVFGQDAAITYNNDRQGFSVEMIYLAQKFWGLYGFASPRFRDRLLDKLAEWKNRRAYRKHLAKNSA